MRPLALALLLFTATLALAQGEQEALYDPLTEVSRWEVDPGREFPGADGKVAAATDPEQGACLRLDYDFTGGGNYVTAARSLDLSQATAVVFSVRQEGGRNGFVRVRDASGQEHMASYAPKREWQRVVLPLDDKTFAGHYQGNNDGKFAFPLQRILIGVNRGSDKTGALYLKDLAFVTSDPAVQFGVRLTMIEPGHIVFVGQAAVVTATLQNRLATAAKLGLQATAVDWYGKTTRFSWNFWPTAGHGETAYQLKLPADRPNYYLLRVQPTAAGKPLGMMSTGVVVAPKPLNYGYDDPRSFFGMQGGQGPRAERIGCKWLRVGRDWRWADLGEGRYWLPDLRPLREAHQLLMYNVTAYPPNWAKQKQREEDFWEAPGWEERAGWWAAFVEHTARTLAPDVDTFEIQNEPDLTCMYHVSLDLKAGTERYLRILRSGAAAVRKGAPNARLAGIDVSGVDYDRGLPFSKEIEGQAGSLFDVYTGHPYAGVRYFGDGQAPLWPVPNQERRKCQDTLQMIADAGVKQSFWVGEKGWGLDVTADPLSGYSREFAACLVQSMTLAHSVPGVERYFWFLDQGANERGYEYGLWRGGIPLPAALAYATLSRTLHHARPLASPDLGPLVQAHCFVCPDTGQGVTVLWSEAQRTAVTLASLPSEVAVLEIMGRKVGGAAAGKALAVPIDRAPVYLTYPVKSAERMAAAVAKAVVTNEQPVVLAAAFVADLQHLGVRLQNVTNQPQTVQLTGPSGAQSVTVAPASTQRVLLPVAKPLTEQRGQELAVRLKARQEVQEARVRGDLSPLPRLAVPASALPPLSFWQEQPAMVLDSRAQVYPPDPTVGWKSAQDLSVKAWAGWDEANLYFAAVVHDPVHFAPSADAGSFWQADSLQLALDPLNDAGVTPGFLGDDREFGLLLGPKGAVALQTVPQRVRLGVPIAVERQGEETVYRVALPWKLIGLQPAAGKVLGLSFIVNQNNGQGRGYWMGLTPGIGEAKRPVAYRDLYLEGQP